MVSDTCLARYAVESSVVFFHQQIRLRLRYIFAQKPSRHLALTKCHSRFFTLSSSISVETPQSRFFFFTVLFREKKVRQLNYQMCVCCGNRTSSCLFDPSPVVWNKKTQDVKAPTRKAEKRCARLTIVEGDGDDSTGRNFTFPSRCF